MKITSLLAAAALLVTSVSGKCTKIGIDAARKQKAVHAFKSNKIVPDVVPSFNPTVDLRGNYNGKQINLGNVFSITETLEEPKLAFTPEAGRDVHTNYTVLFVDPDAPSRQTPLLRQFFHLALYDVKPSCVHPQTSKQQLGYMALTPLSVNYHRYTQLVFRQPEGTYTPPDPGLAVDVARGMFDLAKYVKQGGLKLVGGNFFNEGLNSTAV